MFGPGLGACASPMGPGLDWKDWPVWDSDKIRSKLTLPIPATLVYK